MNNSLKPEQLDAWDEANQSLCKARGILFCMSQMMNAEIASGELEGFAMWAARDHLEDAQAALNAMHGSSANDISK